MVNYGPTGGGTLKQQSYAFDSYGNITSITTNGSPRNTPTSTSTNRLMGTVGYDSAGNATGWNGAAYQYDRFNQMTRMVSGSEDWNYIYTADDERLLVLQRQPLALGDPGSGRKGSP